MIQITADFGSLERFVEELVKREPEVKPDVFKVLQEVAADLEKRVKAEMPVDTGRAKASWGHYTPDDLQPVAVKLTHKPMTHLTRASRTTKLQQISSEEDAVYEENPDELSIYEGTRVPYVEMLNAGHSQQAPAGFIDMAVEAAEKELEVKAAERLDLDFGELGL